MLLCTATSSCAGCSDGWQFRFDESDDAQRIRKRFHILSSIPSLPFYGDSMPNSIMFAVWIFVVLILAAQSSAALPINPPCAWFSGLIRWKAVSARRTKRQSSIAGPVYPADFPDPATISLDGQYHAFSTQSGGKHVPFASLGIDNRWVVKGTDALPMPGRWSTGTDIWAPDVVQLVS